MTGDKAGGGIELREVIKLAGLVGSVKGVLGIGELPGDIASGVVERIGVNIKVGGELVDIDIIGRTIEMFGVDLGGDGETCFVTGTSGGGANSNRLST